MSIRVKSFFLAAAVLVIIGCASTPQAVAPPSASSRFGWLAELAGSCWRQSDFGAEVCYWSTREENLYWFSRNSDGLLGCGRFVLATADARRGMVFSWDEDSAEPVLIFTLTDDSLVTDENSESTRGTSKRISRDRFSIQDRPGAPQLILTRKGSMSATDAGIAQCLAWQAAQR